MNSSYNLLSKQLNLKFTMHYIECPNDFEKYFTDKKLRGQWRSTVSNKISKYYVTFSELNLKIYFAPTKEVLTN